MKTVSKRSTFRNFVCRSALVLAGILTLAAVVFNENLVQLTLHYMAQSTAAFAAEPSTPKAVLHTLDNVAPTLALIVTIVFLLFVSLFTKPSSGPKA